MFLKGILVAGFLLLIGAGCETETWQGFYYPEGCLECEDTWINSPVFSTLDECRDWVTQTEISRVASRKNVDNDDFECGKNCKWNGYANLCKETTR